MRYCGTKTIKTPRLILRKFEIGDREDMLKYWISDPNIQSEYGEPVYTTEAEVLGLLGNWIDKYKNPEFYRWAIIEVGSLINIGQIAFCRVYPELSIAEIEYCIGASFQKNGYALEALEAVIEYALKEDAFQKLEAFHRIENVKSGRVLEKSSMYITDNVQRFIIENVNPEGEVCYCITRNESEQSTICLENCFLSKLK